MATVTVNRNELFKLLNSMKPFVKIHTKKKAMGIMLEATLQKGLLVLSIPNCNMNAAAETSGIAKFRLPFLYFFEIIKMTTTETVSIEITDSKIVIGKTGFKVETVV